DLSKFRRHLIELRVGAKPGSEGQKLRVLYRAEGVIDDRDTSHALRETDSEIEGDPAAGRAPDHMRAVDAEVVQKGIEIVGGSPGLRTGRWVDERPPDVPPIESNEAVTCGRERRNLVFPYAHAAGGGV